MHVRNLQVKVGKTSRNTTRKYITAGRKKFGDGGNPGE
jgi:hypothetical protein